jgi:hypothetical protein
MPPKPPSCLWRPTCWPSRSTCQRSAPVPPANLLSSDRRHFAWREARADVTTLHQPFERQQRRGGGQPHSRRFRSDDRVSAVSREITPGEQVRRVLAQECRQHPPGSHLSRCPASRAPAKARPSSSSAAATPRSRIFTRSTSTGFCEGVRARGRPSLTLPSRNHSIIGSRAC